MNSVPPTPSPLPTPSPAAHPRDLLHGITLENILNQLVQRHGWSEMGRQIPIRCFQFNPTVKSSLTFLRKTAWARQKVESWYIADQMRNERSAATAPSVSDLPPPVLTAIQPATALQTLWQGAAPQNWSVFLGQLDRGAIPYLSHAKLTSLERCPLCYYRQFVVGEKQDSATASVDSLFHQTAKEFYEAQRTNPGVPATLGERINTQALSEESLASFLNALELLQINHWEGREVVAVEEPFFMDLAPELPPLLGVPDLVLREDASFLVVDHKTSKSFNELDPAQLVLYAEALRRQHSGNSVIGFFDEYRLVRNLVSIKKPAFRRTQVSVESAILPDLIARYQRAWLKILAMYQGIKPFGSPDCWACNKKTSNW